MTESTELFAHVTTWPLPKKVGEIKRVLPLNPREGLLFVHTSTQMLLFDFFTQTIVYSLAFSYFKDTDSIYCFLVDETKVLCAYDRVIRLYEIKNKKITGPVWEIKNEWEGDLNALDVTPSLDKFIFSHGSYLTIGSMDNGVIEGTWWSRTPTGADLVKVISPSIVAYGCYTSDVFFSDFREKEHLSTIETTERESIYDWRSCSSGKKFIFGTSQGFLDIFEVDKVSSRNPERTRVQITKEYILYFFEIFPNFLIIVDTAHKFHFVDLDTLEVVVPTYPNLAVRENISTIFQLPNGNLLIACGRGDTVDTANILDFFSKMWENPWRWLFLGFSDKNSAFSGMPRDILREMFQVSHVACYVL
jgi:hypothetical protein